MHAHPALVSIDSPAETAHAAKDVDEVVRALTGLIAVITRGHGTTNSTGSLAEEVLIDTEVDGSRYLVVRMRRLDDDNREVRLGPRNRLVTSSGESL